jgi:hypothetical protein
MIGLLHDVQVGSVMVFCDKVSRRPADSQIYLTTEKMEKADSLHERGQGLLGLGREQDAGQLEGPPDAEG